MKKIIAIVLMLIMLFSFAGCDDNLTHKQRVEKAGKLVIGVTEREPMNYKVDGEWVGFDSEFAKLFAKNKLGVDAEFVVIDWSKRYELLQEGEVDCLWNGLVKLQYDEEYASFSSGYLRNAQVLVMKADRVKDYNDGYEIKDLKFAVEKGSAGAFYTINRNSFRDVEEVKTQKEAIDLVSKGKKDAAVVDITFAKAITGKGKPYEDLGIGFDFSTELYKVAFPKDSDITKLLNEYMTEIRDEELIELANKYGLTLSTTANK